MISKDEEYKVVGTMTSQQSIIDFLKKNEVDVLVYREGSLAGEEDDFKFVIGLKTQHQNMRVVFVAGERSPGDKKIPLLITYAIYDILAGSSIKVQDMAERVFHPAGLGDTLKWLPGKVTKKGIFDDEELEGIEGEDEEETPDEIVKVEDLPPSEVPEDGKTEDAKKGFGSFGMSLKDKLKKTKAVDEPGQETTEEMDLEKAEDKEDSSRAKKLFPFGHNSKPDSDEGHMSTPLIPDSDKIKIPSRAGADDAEELVKARKEIDVLQKKLNEAEKTAAKKSDEAEKAWSEYLNLEQQISSNSKQRVCMFYGAMPGVGTSTLALNVATYLALKRYKVVYIEFNNICPTLSYWYDLGEITQGLEKALMGIETRSYKDVNRNIVTKQNILELNSDLVDRHAKYPDLLHYMFFSNKHMKQQAGEAIKIAPNTFKDLLLLLLYKEGYDYIIVDVYSHSDYHILETVSTFSTTNVFVMNQDIVSIGTSLNKFAALEATGLDFEMLKESEANKKNSLEPVQNFKNFYIINKFKDDAIFSKKKIVDWIQADKKIFYVPENSTEILNATYKALPVILTSKNRDFAMQIKRIAESI